MVTVAVADFVVSATDVAVTVKVRAGRGPAVKRPAVDMVPPVAVQVTAVFAVPVTVAVNCWVWPGCSVALVGEMVATCTGWMVTLARRGFRGVGDRGGFHGEVLRQCAGGVRGRCGNGAARGGPCDGGIRSCRSRWQ